MNKFYVPLLNFEMIRQCPDYKDIAKRAFVRFLRRYFYFYEY
jgi:hypothetical protein